MGGEVNRAETTLRRMADFGSPLMVLKDRGMLPACRFQALLGPEANYSDIVLVFFSTSNQMLRWYLKISSDHFLRQPFELSVRRYIVSAVKKAMIK
jgi:hypothetical protein